ncbi:sulfite exporter TauE/SafE family protein [uncultured Litoreibacter sp.]|uniref:sulfite exporter TauE/SafE family protein n=1 Tax=uncultured Litoreibacter sp. TaxID=1392394 RepID=UPI0026382EA9|nr:sulfite exporter TauE/SafE family protein [uncultured Litoreibacter sp.]
MELFDVILIGIVLGILAVLYSSVGHGGASGYIAIMALFSLSPEVIRPIALSLNVIVAGFATLRFTRAGYVDWRSAIPIIAASMPLAFIGGSMELPGNVYRPLLGGLLVFSAAYMLWSVTRSPQAYDSAKRNLPMIGSVSAGGTIGLFSGLSGIGGGVLLSPLFVIAGWAGARQTAGIAAVFILFNSLAGLAGNLANLNVVPTQLLPWALLVFFGSVVGTGLGVRSFPVKPLIVILAAAVLISGLKFVLL